MRSITLACGLLLAFDMASAAEIYKWVDAQGVTHFGSQPPTGQPATTVNTLTAPPVAKPLEQQPLPKLDSESRTDPQKAIDDQVKQQVAQQEAERVNYCETARTNLAELQNNPRVRVEENGQFRRLGEDERQARIAETRKAIADNCD